MQRGYVVSIVGGAVLLATSFATLFDTGYHYGVPGCSAWTACPGFVDPVRPNALLPWLVVIGAIVAFASPLIKRSWWPAVYATLALGAFAVTALMMWEGGSYTAEEWNYTASATPTPWFTVLSLAMVAVGAGPRWAPARDKDD